MSETLVVPELTELFDVRAMVNVFASHIKRVNDRITNPDFQPTDLAEIRDDVMTLFKYTTEVSKLSRELVDTFDGFVKLMYELEALTPGSVNLVRVPQTREGAGRKPMTVQERIAAAQKRAAQKLDELVDES